MSNHKKILLNNINLLKENGFSQDFCWKIISFYIGATNIFLFDGREYKSKEQGEKIFQKLNKIIQKKIIHGTILKFPYIHKIANIDKLFVLFMRKESFSPKEIVKINKKYRDNPYPLFPEIPNYPDPIRLDGNHLLSINIIDDDIQLNNIIIWFSTQHELSKIKKNKFLDLFENFKKKFENFNFKIKFSIQEKIDFNSAQTYLLNMFHDDFALQQIYYNLNYLYDSLKTFQFEPLIKKLDQIKKIQHLKNFCTKYKKILNVIINTNQIISGIKQATNGNEAFDILTNNIYLIFSQN